MTFIRLIVAVMAFQLPPAMPSDTQRLTMEAKRSFTLDGANIDARAIQLLLTPIADRLPTSVAVDLLGVRRSQARVDPLFSYEHLGALRSGIHVLRTAEGTGGSGIWINLLLVKVIADEEYEERGWRNRLMLVRVGQITLGDRDRRTVVVKDDRIEIHTGSKTSELPTILKIP